MLLPCYRSQGASPSCRRHVLKSNAVARAVPCVPAIIITIVIVACHLQHAASKQDGSLRDRQHMHGSEFRFVSSSSRPKKLYACFGFESEYSTKSVNSLAWPGLPACLAVFDQGTLRN